MDPAPRGVCRACGHQLRPRDAGCPRCGCASRSERVPPTRLAGVEPRGAQIQRAARRVQRGVAAAILVLVLLAAAFSAVVVDRFGEAARVSFCRGCLRQIWRNLDSYAADNDGLLPEYGMDLAAAMAPHLPRRDYRCRLVPPGGGPSFTVAPGAIRVLGADSGWAPEAPMLIETAFRHHFRGERMMAVVFVDGHAGTATPSTLTLPPHPGCPDPVTDRWLYLRR